MCRIEMEAAKTFAELTVKVNTNLANTELAGKMKSENGKLEC